MLNPSNFLLTTRALLFRSTRNYVIKWQRLDWFFDFFPFRFSSLGMPRFNRTFYTSVVNLLNQILCGRYDNGMNYDRFTTSCTYEKKKKHDNTRSYSFSLSTPFAFRILYCFIVVAAAYRKRNDKRRMSALDDYRPVRTKLHTRP